MCGGETNSKETACKEFTLKPTNIVQEEKHSLGSFHLCFELQSQWYFPFTFYILWGLLGFSSRLENISAEFPKEQMTLCESWLPNNADLKAHLELKKGICFSAG